jgi:hypothetical protein
MLHHQRQLIRGQDLPLVSAALRPIALSSKLKMDHKDNALNVVRQAGRLRRLAANLSEKARDDKWRGKAVEEVRKVLAEDPNLAYARYLQSELGDQVLEPAASIFATAFVDAMKQKDSDRLNELASTYPARLHLIDVARAFFFGDQMAADRAVDWLNKPLEVEPRPVAALRGFVTRRFANIRDGVSFIELIAANDNVRLDLIESALVPTEFALAA